jgi:hypothetical protein
MTEHSIYYYPYASFKDHQAPLLKVAAFYFDKLYILDPAKASWDTVGPGPVMQDMKLLEAEGILVRISPEEVLHKYEQAIANAIRADVRNQEFVGLCETSSTKNAWTLALAKIPKAIRQDEQFQPLDRSMQHLLGDFPRSLSSEVASYAEGSMEYLEVYDEYREADQGVVEYRYADYPLAVGEAIMVNHALFGGLLHTGATPLTDERFHHKVLNLKIEQARQTPQIADILETRAKQRKLKRDQLAVQALTDVDLAILSPELPLEAILEYRRDNQAALEEARQELAWLARGIRQNPWSADFEEELEVKTIPGIRSKLKESQVARDKWLQSQRGKNILKGAGLVAGAAAATVTLVLGAAPLLPVAVATSALGMVGSTVIPGIELAMDWRQGKKESESNGLHYLLEIKK